MEITQSPHVPPPGEKPQLKDWPWLITYGLRAFVELSIARIVFIKFAAKEIRARNAKSAQRSEKSGTATDRLIDRMAYIIPRMSDRLPWRSDCLIQAIAAQNWLRAYRAASEIQIGVENPNGGKFVAHAWLMHDGRIVTGGNIDQYEVILSDSTNDQSGASQSIRNNA